MCFIQPKEKNIEKKDRIFLSFWFHSCHNATWKKEHLLFKKRVFFSFVYKSFFQIPETKPFATLTFDLNKNSLFPSFSFFVYSSSLKEKGKKRHLCTLWKLSIPFITKCWDNSLFDDFTFVRFITLYCTNRSSIDI